MELGRPPHKPSAQATALGCAVPIQLADINTFLYYGYSIKIDRENPFPFDMSVLDELDPKRYARMSMEDLLEHGKGALLRTFQDELSRATAKTHVVPLSGGLDSRAILSSLLKLGLKDSIVAVSFGAPGAPDFEMGKLVARKAGVRHVEIDISRIKFSEEELVCCLEGCDTLLPPVQRRINNLVAVDEPGSLTWSGFMGDAQRPSLDAGVAFYSETRDWGASRRLFAEGNKYARQLQLHSSQYDPVSVLPSSPFLSSDKLPFYMQLDYSVRQMSYIRPLLTPRHGNVAFPFTNPRFVGYFFSVPRKYWVDELLYREALNGYDPVLFGLPATSYDGLSYERWKSSGSRLKRRLRFAHERLASSAARAIRPAYRSLFPRTRGYGYFSYKGVYDFDASLEVAIRNSVRDLQNRRILDWLDVDCIVDSHTSGKQDYAKELEVLAGLELNLKARERFVAGETKAHG
jgi:hypothetical protein